MKYKLIRTQMFTEDEETSKFINKEVSEQGWEILSTHINFDTHTLLLMLQRS